MLKRKLIGATAIAIAVATGAMAEDVKIGYTTMDLTNPYFIEIARGVEERAAELGIEVTVHDAKSDAATQVAGFENFIVQGMNAIIVSPIDGEALAPLVEKAHEAGAVVINSNQPVPGADAWMNIVEYDYGKQIGDVAGKYITEKLGGTAKVAILNFPELAPLIDRAKGIEDGLKEFAPGAEIVATQSALTPDRGASAAETILQANPDVRVIVGVNDAGVLGAFETIRAQGLPEEEFALFGLDATAEALARIKEGGMYKATVDINPYGMGKTLVDLSLKVMKEGPIEGLLPVEMKPVTQ